MQLKRREFITLLSFAAVALPLRARSEQVEKLRMIAILGDNASVWSPWTTTFVGRLRELGWIEDRNVAFEYRWSGGQAEPVAEFAAELVRQKGDAIVTTEVPLRRLSRRRRQSRLFLPSRSIQWASA